MRKITTILLELFLSYTTHSQLLNEDFNDIATLPDTGWDFANVGTTIGLTDWFQRNRGFFVSS